MPTTLTIDGTHIHDIPSFYAEINRVFMSDEDWQLGESLDALNDLFYGGYGALYGHDSATIVWIDYEANRAALGLAATRCWLGSKLAQPDVFDAPAIQQQLEALNAGGGPTYFDHIESILDDHPNITVIRR